MASRLSNYLRKLERRGSLPAEEREAFLSLPVRERVFGEEEVAIEEGQPSEEAMFLVDGVVSRQRKLDGHRQIIFFCLQGDAVDLQSIWFRRADHSIVSHGTSRAVFVRHADLYDLFREYPTLAMVLWHDTLVDASILRDWNLNVGHRRARPRIAHLFLEFEARLAAIGGDQVGGLKLPMGQKTLADALGLSLVHFNKSLAILRSEGLLKLSGRRFEILDRARLMKLAQFNPDYLHLRAPPKLIPQRESEPL